jgi:hypothetical protein
MSLGLRHRERREERSASANGDREGDDPATQDEATFVRRSLPLAIRAQARPALKIALLVAVGLAFELVYGQMPLYTGNQHTYLLHGLSQAGVGLLEADWQASTTDPAPVTSLLVAFAAAIGGEWLILLFHALLIGAYGVALVGIGVTLFRLDRWAERLVLLALLLAMHSSIAGTLELGLPDDVRSMLTKGLAGQYAPGLTFQPSLFGVLLVVSLLLYARQRTLPAIATAAAAAIFHPTYLLSAVILCAAYLADTHAGTRARGRTARGAALAVAMLAPVAVYALLAFAPAPGPVHEAAQSVLVDYRIPHHAKPDVWFAPDDAVRLAIVAAGLVLAWRTVLFPVLALAVAASAALTALQLVTGSDTLALLFPWRLSVFLVPVSAAILLAAATRALFGLGGAIGRLAAWVLGKRPRRVAAGGRTAAMVVAGLVIAVCLVAGSERIGRLDAEPKQGFLARLAGAGRAPGDLYLVPAGVYQFRLDAGAPVYVDYKTHPYADREVLEWRRRLRETTRIYRRRALDCHALAALARRERLTHVVTKAPTRAGGCAYLDLTRRSGPYTLFRIDRERAVRA